MSQLNYSKLSIDLTRTLTKVEKKDNGIFFTPPATIKKTLEILENYIESKDIREVLEPSCGSCEYLLAIHNKYNTANITGIEYNKTIFNSISKLANDKIKLTNIDFLKFQSTTKYNLIVGNPPYFVIKKGDVDKKYYNYFDGRPNIFVLFIVKCLELLAPGGTLSFILPKSFLNCLYYNKTRKYIFTNYKILDIIECRDDYLETAQETVLFIVKNTKEGLDKNREYCLDIGEATLFNTPENIAILRNLYTNSKTLKQLGFSVNVGNVVWNQCKPILTDDGSKTLLIYSSNIKNNKVEIQTYANLEKKNYIDKKGERGPLLVINRGYGVGQYSFDYCIVDLDRDYLVENHLICIRYNSIVPKEQLLELYNKVIASFKNKKTTDFIKLYFGNNAINTTEICEILPIYDI
jgi:tRNA1(Val) A37 N6-methylase TrmN6